MCGRFASLSKEELLFLLEDNRELFDTNGPMEVSPGMEYPVITKTGVMKMLWGMKADWSKGQSIINARQETVNTKEFFKDSFIHRRCIVKVPSFYEWDKYKNKYVVRRNDGKLMNMAGIYTRIGNQNCFVVMTQEATTEFAPIHSRLPFILEDEEVHEYLYGNDEGKWCHPKLINILMWDLENPRKPEQASLF